MPLKLLIGPIAAATIVTAFWFAAMWRGHQMERRRGKPTWQYEVGLYGYLAAMGMILYLIRSGDLTTGAELFGATLIGEGLGVVITYTLLQAFVLSRGRPWSERAAPMFFAILLTSGMFAGVLMPR